ncbi:poly(A) polymerase [Catellatospora sp. NPDC049609]|uniref:poly(A) polymerase n=1 Tax=Catellatospora sp. NPDC049609 TaxID=3155505 RepID=UPI00341EA38D
MHTSEQIYHRVRWDPRFDPERFVLGVQQRGAAPKRVPLPAFTPGGDIPWHRILFVEADGEVVWDRAAGIDRLDTADAGRVREQRLLPAPFFTPRTPHAWHPSRGWAAVPAPAAGTGPDRLRVLTWNTLWDRYDRDRIDTARRRPLLVAALREADADVIALQEAEPGLLDLLLREPWVRERYTLCGDPADPADLDGGGLLLLSRLPVREAGWHRLGPHKAVAAVTVDTAAGPLVVAATHLSSDRSGEGALRRQGELTMLAEGLSGVGADLVLAGDFNDGGDTPTAMLGLADAWSLVHGPGDDTPTFDPAVNPLAAVSSLSGQARRLDRVLLRGGLRAEHAALLGDRPQPDGLFPSDHFGLAVDLACPGDTDALDVAPTARTALAWLPPQRLWPALQELRQAYDPSFHRWPPHVNVLFGFVPESAFERAAPLLAAVAARTAPFGVRLDGVHTFGHRDDATVWLDPAAAGEEPWARLWQGLRERFPRCRGRGEGFTPHLTLGRARDVQRVAAACAARLDGMSAQVGELVLLSRRGDEPMRPRAVLTLGTGDLHWLPDPPATDQTGSDPAVFGRTDADPAGSDPPGSGRAGADPAGADQAGAVVAALNAALGGGVHVVGSRRMGCALPGADLDLVAVRAGTVTAADVAARVVAALPAATGIREVTGARVPGLRLRCGGVDVDLVLVGTGDLDPAEAVARRTGLGEAAAVALSAVGDADAVLAAVARRQEAFALLARQVKAWARAKGLDCAPFGGLPGLAWAVLAARTVTAAPPEHGPADLLRRFFEDWAAWDWRRPVALDGEPGGAYPAGTILTPTAPVRSCTAQLGPGGLDLLMQELYQAWETLETAGAESWAQLVAPPPLHRRHAHWAVVTVPDDDDLHGRVRGRMRALLTTLEEAGFAQAHAWPRPWRAGRELRYAIGLGRAAAEPEHLAALTRRWCADLPGVRVDPAGDGAVPTLR